ncbi:hypothetical protein Back11_14000 [Paenibacillus baekrokdamisoli]|uniref:Uncharacterized protein n=1 Tax=Paenibacillus baekrokdamisoli TaxID=1712516 RepID=A0A3G9IVC8_9BACL|nr:hypothetical protein [Paenibacillus baekrokdamisoli]MBB3070706.1 hypothetical protein [Paenibacillus baekrokdamisoli]BBH20055.1 hypothetical protein Back11_14000 [Paenibacillus baekrokdamisoli]
MKKWVFLFVVLLLLGFKATGQKAEIIQEYPSKASFMKKRVQLMLYQRVTANII